MARVLPLLLVACLAVLAAGNKSLEGYRVYRLQPINDQQVEWVRGLRVDSALDFWSNSDVMVSPERQETFLEQLSRGGIAYETLVTDVQMTIDAEKMRQLLAPRDGMGRAVSFTKYNRYNEITAYLAELDRDYPDVVTVDSIGTSYEGRAIPIIKITSDQTNRDLPVILIDAGIHAREWIAPAMALYIIQQLVENPENADLIANVEWHIIPLLNPDGYEYSQTTYRLWRKTRSRSTCSSSDPFQGVDANRNFDFHWMEVGASSNPCSDTYAGTTGFSEPETAALRVYVNSNSRIELYLTFHSYGNYLLYPWGYTPDPPDDEETLKELAEAANDAQVEAGGSSYSIGSSTNVLYAAAGGSDDWVKGVGGVDLSYTIELPGGGVYGFDLPASAIVNTVSTFWPAVRVYGEYIADIAETP